MISCIDTIIKQLLLARLADSVVKGPYSSNSKTWTGLINYVKDTMEYERLPTPTNETISDYLEKLIQDGLVKQMELAAVEQMYCYVLTDIKELI